MQPSIITSIIAASVAVAILSFKDKLNFLLMGFFRDLARVKARRRRMGNQKALIFSQAELSVLFKKENDPLEDVCLSCSPDHSIPDYTVDELNELGDGRNGRLLVALFGRVYDVTSGAKFYGPDGRYKGFAGKDVSYALSSGCMEQRCLESLSLEPYTFTEKEISEGKRWLSFFETHDKYSMVGKLINTETPDEIIDRILDRPVDVDLKG